jgi:hypothetical protein
LVCSDSELIGQGGNASGDVVDPKNLEHRVAGIRSE